MRFSELAELIRARPEPVRLVAIDGPGGAGKSTFASLLAHELGGAPVVHTDDFATAENPINWWPRLREQVIEPLATGGAARYQRDGADVLADWERWGAEEDRHYGADPTRELADIVVDGTAPVADGSFATASAPPPR